MSISRRQFILGTAAGLILPSYYDKVFSYWENHGEPLIEVPRSSEIDLIAIDRGGDGLELNWGDPNAEPPEMTVRKFAHRYYGSEDEYRDAWCWEEDEEVDFDADMDPEYVLDFWARSDSPNARAYRLLEDLDLSPHLSGEDAVGELRFIDGPCPGNDYLGVEADCDFTVGLLQKRLNDLNTGIRVSLVEGW
jgi:hypothetical protein